MRIHIAALAGAMALTGCSKQITDFVAGGEKKPPVQAQPGTPLLGQTPLRLSAGVVYGTASDGSDAQAVDAALELVPSERALSGTTVDAAISLQRQWAQ